MAAVPCPKCSEDFCEDAVVRCVQVGHYATGPAADLILQCSGCEAQWNVFVPMKDFFSNPVEVG